MTVKEVMQLMESIAPGAYAEDFDNTGLLVGNRDAEVTGILVTLDTLETVLDEAIQKDCNLIVSFHPIIFSGLKKLTGSDYVQRSVMKAIQHDISIFAVHTALDNAWNGVNAKICEKLGLTEREVLLPRGKSIKKLLTYVPEKDAAKVRKTLFDLGAGNIGNYSNCSFNITGQGSFKPDEGANPTVGKKGMLHFEKEIQVGVTFAGHLEGEILRALFEAHPYEEVAYEITTLDNKNQKLGMGMIGALDQAMAPKDFLEFVKGQMSTGCIRHSAIIDKKIKRVAVLGGSGSFAINAAISQGADAYITADLKYHDFFKAEGKILLTDIGHYESEQYTKELIVSELTKKITNFAPAFPKGRVLISEINSNPIRYY